MAAQPDSPASNGASSKKRAKRKRVQQHNDELERFDSLAWNSSLSADDPFSFVVGSNELEGGFLSLEEIDESEYGLEIPKPEGKIRKEKSKPTKQSNKEKGGEIHGDGGNGVEVSVEKGENVKAEKKKKKKKKKTKKKAKEVEKVEDVDSEAGDGVESEVEEKEEDGNVKTEQGSKKTKKKKVNETQEKEVPVPG